MSTIVSSFIKDRASARQIDTLTVTDATPKAFSCFNGITMGAVVTFNVSSFSDDAVGQWTMIYTAKFNSWHAAGGCSHNPGVAFHLWSGISNNGGQTTMTSYPVGSAVQSDSAAVTVSATGRLA